MGTAILMLLPGGETLRAQATVTLTAEDGSGGDKFGSSVSLDGDLALIGASGANIGSAADGGAAYIRHWDGLTWKLEQKLNLPDPVSLDTFGFRVGLRGDLCVIGVPGRKLLLKNSAGALFIYRCVGGVWFWHQTITAVNAAAFDLFGSQFALTQDRIVVGVSAKDVSLQSQQGQAYVYRFDGKAFTLEQQLFALDGAAGDRFGASVDIDGERIVVGAPAEDGNGATDAGAAYVFEFAAGAWVQRQKLLPAGGLSLDAFGTSVAVDGPTIVGGAPSADPTGASGRGAAWVFRLQGALFSEEQMLLAADGLSGDAFGTSVAADGNMIVVGAPKDDVGTMNDVGSAWLYRFTGGAWTGEHVVAPNDISASGQFGSSLAVDGGLMLVSAPNDSVGAFATQGSICVMKTLQPSWTWVGHAFPGQLGAPDLLGTGSLAPGSSILLRVDDAPPLTNLALCVSAVQLSAPFKGGVLVPSPDVVLAGLPTDDKGVLSIGGVWPGGIPAGFPITYQAWVFDRTAYQGFSATNAITSMVP